MAPGYAVCLENLTFLYLFIHEHLDCLVFGHYTSYKIIFITHIIRIIYTTSQQILPFNFLSQFVISDYLLTFPHSHVLQSGCTVSCQSQRTLPCI